MTYEENKDAEKVIESFIDRSSVRGVLETIAYICEQKAEHILANWQDQKTARAWESSADKISRLSERIAT